MQLCFHSGRVVRQSQLRHPIETIIKMQGWIELRRQND